MVAISAFGGLCVHIMASSRMCFVGARNGHMPALLSHINVNYFTPVPSLVFLVSPPKILIPNLQWTWQNLFHFQCILSLAMLVISDVHVLITYSMIVESFFIMLSVSSVLYFRYKEPDMPRPIKVYNFASPFSRKTISNHFSLSFAVAADRSDHIFHYQRISHGRAMLCGPIWSWNGRTDHSSWHSRLLVRCVVEGQTEVSTKWNR